MGCGGSKSSDVSGGTQGSPMKSSAEHPFSVFPSSPLTPPCDNARQQQHSDNQQNNNTSHNNGILTQGKIQDLKPPDPTRKKRVSVDIIEPSSPLPQFLPSLSTKCGETTGTLQKGIDENGNKTINEYAVLADLGRGAFGKVKLCMHKPTEELCAIKILNRSLLSRLAKQSGDQKLASCAREIEIMKSLQHPNVVQLYEVIDDPAADKLYLVMDYCDKGPISNLFPIITGDSLRRYLHDILSGLKYLHSQGIVHRDIKPQNILLTSDKTKRRDICKITDFGVSHCFESEQGDMIRERKNLHQGTLMYFSPEVVCGLESISGKKCDVWAFGVTAYELAFKGKKPFKGESIQEICAAITNEPLHIEEVTFEMDFYDLLASALDKDPNTRASVDDMLKHSYFNDMSEPTSPYTPSPFAVARGQSMSSSSSSSFSTGSMIDLTVAKSDGLANPSLLTSKLYASKQYLLKVFIENDTVEGQVSDIVTGAFPESFRGKNDVHLAPTALGDTGCEDPSRVFSPLVPCGTFQQSTDRCCVSCRVEITALTTHFVCVTCQTLWCTRCRYSDNYHNSSHSIALVEPNWGGCETSTIEQTLPMGHGGEEEFGVFIGIDGQSAYAETSALLTSLQGSFSRPNAAEVVLLSGRDEVFLELTGHTCKRLCQVRKSWASDAIAAFQQSHHQPQSTPANNVLSFSRSLSHRKSTYSGGVGGGVDEGGIALQLPTQADVHGDKDVSAIIHDCIMENEPELCLEYLKLAALPNMPVEMDHVCILTICNNNLTELPEDMFTYFPNLERLNVANNQLQVLPRGLFDLPHLVLLDANANQLSSIPSDIKNLVYLEILALDCNRIVEIPEVSTCVELTKLFLFNNPGIQSIDITQFDAMKSLQLGLDNKPDFLEMFKNCPSHINILWNKIYPDAILPGKLFLGSLRTAQNEDVLNQLNIRTIITVGRDLRTPPYPSHITQHRVQVDDNDGVNLSMHFMDMCSLIHNAIMSESVGGGVLVHCFAGMSRSATIVVSYLMIHHHMRLDIAYEHTKTRRPAIHPNNGFFSQLVELDRKLFGEDGRKLVTEQMGRSL